jgi:glucose-6-phosphate 1-dehydrogenase
MSDKQKKHPLEEPGRAIRSVDPCSLVIFGATGDLTARKLAPAIYNLGKDGLLPPNFACIGFARREKTNEVFRQELKESIGKFSRTKPLDESFWENFQNQIFYHTSEFDEDEGYIRLSKLLKDLDNQLKTKQNRIFYLSVQPKFFPIIIEKLSKHGMIYDAHKEGPWSRVIIEKPFGHDTETAQILQSQISKYLHESQTYRIDHYLGKETVQNLLVFRFANSIFEQTWNNKHIDQVQITVAEEIGVGTRGNFYEEEGMLRDMVQNHMMQLLSLVAMEPPVSLNASAIRDEKVKVLQAIRPLEPKDVVRGQYGPGFIDGEKVIGYNQEKDVNPKSNIETYVAMKMYIDSWRWSGVPFYLRAGKRLPKRTTEIAIIFKDAPGILFQQEMKKNDPNVLVVRIQPDEGIALKINSKVPGPSIPIQPVKMDFRYGAYFGASPPEAYERLIWDCMLGDSTLFIRGDEVKLAWEILTPVLKYWEENPTKEFPNYASGTWGPLTSDEMMQKDNRFWRNV